MTSSQEKITEPELPAVRQDQSETRVRRGEPYRPRQKSVTEEVVADLTRDPRAEPD
jgi:hypothetical protein